MDTSDTCPADTPSPQRSICDEWTELKTEIEKLRTQLQEGLLHTGTIMSDWESRIAVQQRNYREDCQRLAKKENALQKQYEKLYEKEREEARQRAQILTRQIEDQENRIRDLLQKQDQAQQLIGKINRLADFTNRRLNISTDDPATIVNCLQEAFTKQEDTISQLRQEVTRRAPASEVDELKAERDRLKNNNEDLKRKHQELLKDYESIKTSLLDLFKLREENKIQSVALEAQRTELAALRDQVNSLQSLYADGSERESRIVSIEKPYLNIRAVEKSGKPQELDTTDEVKWLSNIEQGCRNFGLKFMRRILYSFHTSLKIAEWSPITVLAGVSGTGKSELPRLYSHFGGINFLNLAVQPNWDSQEAMLGYFNTIENYFDAQPVLRLLAQSQQPWSTEKQGLRDYVTLILLDEMNLSHVELYFAEFLSKLEQRRGYTDGEEPFLDVKLGAKMMPYPLRLGRNVLWAGTMNQDETTKTLSDKVLDRSIIINFPRPVKLESRRNLTPLPASKGLLPRKTWNLWIANGRKRGINDEDIQPYKSRVEAINELLGKAGRALGHRVWQSIENYMQHYPTVVSQRKDDPQYRAALEFAFEDQLVQKVMPKLRGLETRGSVRTNCLNPIRSILEDEHPSLVPDFDVALEAGYGQFMWNSALYLEQDSRDN